jgi:hypothetical protein
MGPRVRNLFLQRRVCGKLDGTVQGSSALVPLLTGIPGIGDHFSSEAQAGSCQSLQEGGANIEGLAARGGNLYVGFRAPSRGGKARVPLAQGQRRGSCNCLNPQRRRQEKSPSKRSTRSASAEKSPHGDDAWCEFVTPADPAANLRQGRPTDWPSPSFSSHHEGA